MGMETDFYLEMSCMLAPEMELLGQLHAICNDDVAVEKLLQFLTDEKTPVFECGGIRAGVLAKHLNVVPQLTALLKDTRHYTILHSLKPHEDNEDVLVYKGSVKNYDGVIDKFFALVTALNIKFFGVMRYCEDYVVVDLPFYGNHLKHGDKLMFDWYEDFSSDLVTLRKENTYGLFPQEAREEDVEFPFSFRFSPNLKFDFDEENKLVFSEPEKKYVVDSTFKLLDEFVFKDVLEDGTVARFLYKEMKLVDELTPSPTEPALVSAIKDTGRDIVAANLLKPEPLNQSEYKRSEPRVVVIGEDAHAASLKTALKKELSKDVKLVSVHGMHGNDSNLSGLVRGKKVVLSASMPSLSRVAKELTERTVLRPGDVHSIPYLEEAYVQYTAKRKKGPGKGRFVWRTVKPKLV